MEYGTIEEFLFDISDDDLMDFIADLLDEAHERGLVTIKPYGELND